MFTTSVDPEKTAEARLFQYLVIRINTSSTNILGKREYWNVRANIQSEFNSLL